MLYLGIDLHLKQMTVSLRNQDGLSENHPVIVGADLTRMTLQPYSNRMVSCAPASVSIIRTRCPTQRCH